MPEDGVSILLVVQLIASLAAALAWWRAAREPSAGQLRLAAYLTCGWFALFAGFIAFLFDVDLVSLRSLHLTPSPLGGRVPAWHIRLIRRSAAG